MNENIKAVIRTLGFLILVAIFVAFIKHADKLGECVIEEDNGTITHPGLYGDAQACHNLIERLCPYQGQRGLLFSKKELEIPLKNTSIITED